MDQSIFNKLKPRQLNIEKEKLYEENMALKLRNNTLLEEILKLRTKFFQVEKELHKKDDQNEHLQGGKSNHMVNGLKFTVKELKNEIQVKNEEILKLKKNLKSTRINEIELEVQAYIDECTRLRHHLEEIMKQRDTPQINSENNDEKSMQQGFILNNLKKENLDLNRAVIQSNEEINKWRERVLELEKSKKQNSAKKGEIKNLKSEISKLKGHLENTSKDYANKENGFKEEIQKLKKICNDSHNKILSYEGKIKELNLNIEEQAKKIQHLSEENKNSAKNPNRKNFPPKLFRLINLVLTSKKISLGLLFDKIQKSKRNVMNIDDFTKGFKLITEKFKDKYIKETVGFLKTSNKNEISLDKLEEFYNEFLYDQKFEISSEEEMISSSMANEKIFLIDTPVSETVVMKKIDEKKLEDETEFYESDQDFTENLNDTKEKILINKEDKNEEKNKENMKENNKNEKNLAKDTEKQIDEKKLISQDLPQKEVTVKEDEKKEIGGQLKENNFDEKNKKDRALLSEKVQQDTKKAKKSKKKSKNPHSKSPKKEISDPVIKSLFDHISFRLQINRVPKSDLFFALFGQVPSEKLFSKVELSSVLKKPPLNFLTPEIETLNEFLLDTPKSTAKSIEEKLVKHTENWEIFSAEDEENFDSEILELIGKNSENLINLCKKYDKELRGVISISEFKSALKELSIKIAPRLMKYMILLFYSHDMKLDKVPYLNFINAYGEASQNVNEGSESNEEGLNDEDKAKIVRHYLGIMAQILIQNKRAVLEVFECDENGIISPQEFIEGLQRIGLGDLEKDHIMLMLEALQYEESQEVCVFIEELEEILLHYGVPQLKDNDENTEQNKSEIEEKHYKKVSLLDSDNYELSEDSPERIGKKNSENGISEASPFLKNKSFDEDNSLQEHENYQSDYED